MTRPFTIVGTVVPLHRGVVVPIRPGVMAQHDPVNLYRSLEEQRRIAAVIEDERRDRRIIFWQRFIHYACIVLAVGCALYFAGQFVR